MTVKLGDEMRSQYAADAEELERREAEWEAIVTCEVCCREFPADSDEAATHTCDVHDACEEEPDA